MESSVTEWISALSALGGTIIAAAAAIVAYKTYLAIPTQDEPHDGGNGPEANGTEDLIVTVFDTSRQATILKAVGNGLECDMEYKDGRRTKRQNPQWRLSAADCANILTKGDYSVHSGYKVRTGRFSIGQRKNWLYSKRLFGGEEQLRQTIAQLLTRARDSDGQ